MKVSKKNKILYKDNFYAFLHFFYSKGKKGNFFKNSKIINNQIFEDINFERYFNFAEKINDKDKLCFWIFRRERHIGLTTFFCLYSYYKCCLNENYTVFYIIDSSSLKYYSDTFYSIGKELNVFFNLEMLETKAREYILTNNSKICFKSDITYSDVLLGTGGNNTIIFDSRMKNKEKFIPFIKKTNIFVEKIILNFYDELDAEISESLETFFGEKLKIINKISK